MKYTTVGNFLIPPMIRKSFNWNRPQDDYDVVRIRKDYFDTAKKLAKFVLVQSPNGEKVFMPKTMKDIKIYNEVFLFPDRPMKMYELVIPKCEKKDLDYYRYQ